MMFLALSPWLARQRAEELRRASERRALALKTKRLRVPRLRRSEAARAHRVGRPVAQVQAR